MSGQKHLPPSSTSLRSATARLKTIGDAVEAAIAGDPAALDQLEKLGGEAAVDEWLAACEARQHRERRQLAERLEALRGTDRITVALQTLSHGRHG